MAVLIDVHAALREYPLPPEFRAELEKLFRENGKASQSKSRLSLKPLSMKTQKERIQRVALAYCQLRADGFKLHSPYSLKEKHVEHLVGYWVTVNEVGTLENDLSHLRAIAGWMNKPHMVKSRREYACAEHMVRLSIAERDKSWEGNNVDQDALVEAINKLDPGVGMVVCLAAAFGLRRMEAMMLRPGRVRRGDTYLPVEKGTKGGRPRNVRIEHEWQYDLLEAAHRMSHPEHGSMIPHPYTIAKWTRRIYYVLERCGVTGDGLGVTFHGLRHGFAQRLYQRLTGVAAAIKGMPERPTAAAHEHASQELVETLGHSRRSKANAYLSSFTYKPRKAPPAIEQVQAALLECDGNKKAAAAKLGISRQALYRCLDNAALKDPKTRR